MLGRKNAKTEKALIIVLTYLESFHRQFIDETCYLCVSITTNENEAESDGGAAVLQECHIRGGIMTAAN